MNAKTRKSDPKKRMVRLAKTSTARDAIGTLDHSSNLFILTMGSFSLIDALCVILDQIGPAHITCSTWAAGEEDMHRLAATKPLSCRFLLDRSLENRKPKACQAMRDLFGDENIRTAKNHAKWTTLCNDEWQIVLRTSANLNSNVRIELIEIADDPGLARFLLEFADVAFSELKQGEFDFEGLPPLDELTDDTSALPSASAGELNAENLSLISTGPRRT